MDIAVLGVDLGKNVCSVVGLDASGAVVMRPSRSAVPVASVASAAATSPLRFSIKAWPR